MRIKRLYTLLKNVLKNVIKFKELFNKEKQWALNIKNKTM